MNHNNEQIQNVEGNQNLFVNIKLLQSEMNFLFELNRKKTITN